MKKTVRLSPAGPQLVREMLNSRLLLGFVIASGVHYALYLAAMLLGDSGLLPSLVMILSAGFVTAESVILYQRKESRNLKHLSVFCLIVMILSFLLFLFLGAVVVTLNMVYGEQNEEIMQLWAEANLSEGMPYMIATVAMMGLGGLASLFLWKALGMCHDVLEHRGEMRNWFLPAAIFLALTMALGIAMTVLQSAPAPFLNVAVSVVGALRNGLLAALMAQTAARYKQIIG